MERMEALGRKFREVDEDRAGGVVRPLRRSRQSGGSAGSAVPVADSPLLTSAAFVFVELRVVDADGIPIRVSNPSSVVFWGSGGDRANQLVPIKPAEGGGKSNRFTAAIEAGLREGRLRVLGVCECSPSCGRLRMKPRRAASESAICTASTLTCCSCWDGR
jgi:hypothetical protein